MQLGQNTPFLTGSDSDSLIGLNPATGKWTYFTIPYPLGFYARGMDGRIDDANAGWKGRGAVLQLRHRTPCGTLKAGREPRVSW